MLPVRVLVCLAAALPALAQTAQPTAPPVQTTPEGKAQPAPVIRRPPPSAQGSAPALQHNGASPAEGQRSTPRPLTLPGSTAPNRPGASVPAQAGTARTDSQDAASKPRPLTLSPRVSANAGQTSSSTGAPASRPSASRSAVAAAGTGSATSAAATTTAKKSPPTDRPAPPSVLNGSLNRNIVALDPARGGADGGSRIADNILEKDVTLAFAFRLRSLLNARGFTVSLTREDDAAMQPKSPDTPLSLNDRAGISNHARAVACLQLHATGSGTGVHLYSSELSPAPGEATPLPWLTAQAAWVSQSHHLERLLGEALNRASIPLVSSLASVRPLDSLTCPAVVVELAPRTDDPSSINEASYQQRVAEALAGTIVFWQSTAQAPVKLAPPPKPKPPASTSSPALEVTP